MLTTMAQIKNQLIPRLIWYVNKKIAEAGGTSDNFITAEELQAVIDGTYTPTEDDSGITEQDIQDILSGNYTPVDDDDALTADDFIF